MNYAHVVPLPRILDSASQLEAVSLSDLDEAQLHDRVETKALLKARDVPAVLEALHRDYFILDHAGTRLQAYRNQYFDSADFRNYREHHNRVGVRSKVRYRSYVNSGLTFFEIKQKVHARTMKVRQESCVPLGPMWGEDEALLRRELGHYEEAFEPSLIVAYDRLLLVRRDFAERVTIDLNIHFSGVAASFGLPHVAIFECKQERLDRRSPSMQAIHRRPQEFSKYCVGLAGCDPTLKRNRFKATFRAVDALRDPLPSRS